MEEADALNEKTIEFYNDVRWAPCSLGRACSFIMMPFVVGIVGLTYVPYVHHFYDGTVYGSMCLFVFHLLLLLMATAYFQVVFTDPGTVPIQWHMQNAANPRPAYKKCRHTHQFKPPRAHYCGVTRRVVLNLDHFCPWVANAVGFKNRKFFVLFCFYSMLTCTFSAATLGPFALAISSTQQGSGREPMYKALSLMAFIMDVTFAIALSFFSFAHFYMAGKNQTSIEDSASSKKYDRGWRENMRSVFGTDSKLWFLPTHHARMYGDGVHWKLADGSWDGCPDKKLRTGDEEEL